MESDDLLRRLREYDDRTRVYHHRFMSRARKIEKAEDFVEILDLLHANYLVQETFQSLARVVADSS